MSIISQAAALQDKTKMGHRVILCLIIPPPPTQILCFSLLTPLVHGAGELWFVFTELLDSLKNWFLLLAHRLLCTIGPFPA